MNLAQSLNLVIADPSGVRNGGVFPDPDPLVDRAARMFSKMAVHVLVDPLLPLIQMDDEVAHSLFLLLISVEKISSSICTITTF